MPEPILDSPENVAAALMGSPPRKPDECRYAQEPVEEVPVDPIELDNWQV